MSDVRFWYWCDRHGEPNQEEFPAMMLLIHPCDVCGKPATHWGGAGNAVKTLKNWRRQFVSEFIRRYYAPPPQGTRPN